VHEPGCFVDRHREKHEPIVATGLTGHAAGEVLSPATALLFPTVPVGGGHLARQ
jgi:hypothetical protein